MREIARTITTLAVAVRRRLRRARRPAPPVQVTRPAGITEAMALEHLARAGALTAQGDNRAAEGAYRAAFELDPYLVEAHDGLARLHWPGPDYLAWLAHFHAIRRPAVYLEIGVDTGRTLALARAPTRAIGVDPAPKIDSEFTAETHLYRETSDRFFRENRLARFQLRRIVDQELVSCQT